MEVDPRSSELSVWVRKGYEEARKKQKKRRGLALWIRNGGGHGLGTFLSLVRFFQWKEIQAVGMQVCEKNVAR